MSQGRLAVESEGPLVSREAYLFSQNYSPRSLLTREPAGGFVKPGKSNWFHNVVVHFGGKIPLAITVHVVGCYGHNGKVTSGISLLLSNQSRGFPSPSLTGICPLGSDGESENPCRCSGAFGSRPPG